MTASLVWLVLGTSSISILLYTAVIARGEAARISARMSLVPPVAMALAGLALSAPDVYIVPRQTR